MGRYAGIREFWSLLQETRIHLNDEVMRVDRQAIEALGSFLGSLSADNPVFETPSKVLKSDRLARELTNMRFLSINPFIDGVKPPKPILFFKDASSGQYGFVREYRTCDGDVETLTGLDPDQSQSLMRFNMILFLSELPKVLQPA